MKSEELLFSLDHVGEDLLEAADQTVLIRKHRPWGRTAAAAVLALAVGVGGFLLLKDRFSGSNPTPATNPSTVSSSEEPQTTIDPLSLLGESLSESGSYTDIAGNQTDYSYRLPCINADTEGAKAINAAIEQGMGTTVRRLHEEMEQKSSLDLTTIDYVATAWNDVLSVKLFTSAYPGGLVLYDVYNYECSTGRWLKTQELLDRMGILEEDFREACRIQFEKTEYHNPDGSLLFFDDDELLKKDGNYYRCRNKGASNEQTVEVQIHPYQDGQIEMIAPICTGAGAAFYYYVLPLDLSAAHAPETTEQQEQDADALRAELEALFRDEDCDNLNPYLQALTCYYESPAQVDFREFFYNGLGLEFYEDEATKEMLKSKYPAFFSNLYTDCNRLTEAEMDKVLRQVFGVGIDQTRKKNLDSFFYVPETDSYYHQHGDTNAIGRPLLIQDVRTTEDGLVLFTYKVTEGSVREPSGFSNIRTVALKKENGVYHIVSHLPGEWVTEKAEQENEPETTEQQEQNADALRTELDALFNNGQWDNPYLLALTSAYGSPERVDFFEFFYNGVGREVYEDQETLEMLKTKYPEYFADLHIGCDCMTEAEMDALLRQIFGVGIDQTKKRDLDKFLYIPETDTYYHAHGDTNALGGISILDVCVKEDGRILCNYQIRGILDSDEAEEVYTVALKKENGVYHIISNLPGEFTTAEDLALLPNTDWRMEAEAGDEGPDVRELKVLRNMTIFYQSGDQNSEFNYWSEGIIEYLEEGTIRLTLCEVPEDGNIAERTGEAYEAEYSCVQKDGSVVLTQLSDEGFYNDPKGTVLKFQPVDDPS